MGNAFLSFELKEQGYRAWCNGLSSDFEKIFALEMDGGQNFWCFGSSKWLLFQFSPREFFCSLN